MERTPGFSLTDAQKENNIIKLMLLEVDRADKKYEDDKMSPEEMDASILTLECELFELKREIARKKKRPDLMRKEAVQVMAMAFKFLRDVCYADEKVS